MDLARGINSTLSVTSTSANLSTASGVFKVLEHRHVLARWKE